MNEAVQAVSMLVSNVGFPIAAFCAIFWMCNKTIADNTAQQEKTLSANTQAITELKTLVQTLVDRMEQP